MKALWQRLWHEEQGQDLTEYALLLVLIALAAVAGMGRLATEINSVFSTAAANLAGNT
jgi:pilus assembly protein Flp/PilA